jgi:hypothetical protein
VAARELSDSRYCRPAKPPESGASRMLRCSCRRGTTFHNFCRPGTPPVRTFGHQRDDGGKQKGDHKKARTILDNCTRSSIRMAGHAIGICAADSSPSTLPLGPLPRSIATAHKRIRPAALRAPEVVVEAGYADALPMVTAGTIHIRRGLDMRNGAGVVGHQRIELRTSVSVRKLWRRCHPSTPGFLRISVRMSGRCECARRTMRYLLHNEQVPP